MQNGLDHGSVQEFGQVSNKNSQLITHGTVFLGCLLSPLLACRYAASHGVCVFGGCKVFVQSSLHCSVLSTSATSAVIRQCVFGCQRSILPSFFSLLFQSASVLLNLQNSLSPSPEATYMKTDRHGYIPRDIGGSALRQTDKGSWKNAGRQAHTH